MAARKEFTMSDDIIRDERGRIVKGSPGLHRKQDQPDQPDPTPDTDTPSPDFDAAIIAAAHGYGTSAKAKAGIAGYCASLMASRPVEFATLLSKALTRKAEAAQAEAIGIAGCTVVFDSVPPGTFYNPQTRNLETLPAPKAAWEEMAGMETSSDEPPPAKPVLVAPVEAPAEPNEIAFGGQDDTEPEQPSPRSTDMNDMLRSFPKPRFTKPDW
jgi:hypothetical protein